MKARPITRLLRALTALGLAAWISTEDLPLARADAVLPAFRSAILVRALGYERSILAGNGPVLLVIVQAEGLPDARAMFEAFVAMSERLKIGSRELRVEVITHKNIASTEAQLNEKKPHAVYFSAGLEAIVAQTSSALERLHAVSMCADGAQLPPQCVIGVQSIEERNELVVRLTQAKRAGLSFDSRMLRLARVLP